VARHVLLLHGFTHTGASWEPVRQALGESYRAIAPDIRGHGSATDRQPVELALVLADLRHLLGGCSILVGYSMGGRLALHLALAEPERIERLILVGASPGLSDPGQRAARRSADERLANEIDHLSIEQFAERWARTPVLTGLPEAVAARTHQDRLRSTPAGLARALRGLGTGALPSLWTRLNELPMPVTLVVGERDHRFQAIAQQMARCIPQSGVTIVPGAGHPVHLEAPTRVAEVIARDEPTTMLSR
jgi:2-succinyl-6-hydroxy-2,4-cyclohexadiene-1-carboxylate synthase